MKKLFATITTALFALAFTSCITSVQPLVTPENAVLDDRIQGNWTHDNDTYTIAPFFKSKLVAKTTTVINGKQTTISVDGQDSAMFLKSYMVSFDKNGWNYNMVTGLTKIDNNLFMDLTPLIIDNQEPNVTGDPYQSTVDYLAGATIAKVNVEAGKITLHFLNGEFIKEQVLAGRLRLKHESEPLFGTFMITASTGELHSFLKKYGNDERIFNKPAIILTRKAG